MAWDTMLDFLMGAHGTTTQAALVKMMKDKVVSVRSYRARNQAV